MSTDFYDEDLLKSRQPPLKIKLGSDDAPRDGRIPPSGEMPVRPVSDLPLTNLARHKYEVNEQMVDKVQQLERLKTQKEELERERRVLEELRRKQDDFDSGKRDLRAKLSESLLRMEKEQSKAERLTEFLDETRRGFRTRLEEIEALNEELWPDDAILDELNSALALLENVRVDYNKATAKWEALNPHPVEISAAPPAAAHASAPMLFEESAAHHLFQEEKGLSYWIRAGFGFTLPLVVLIVILFVVWFALLQNGLI